MCLHCINFFPINPITVLHPQTIGPPKGDKHKRRTDGRGKVNVLATFFLHISLLRPVLICFAGMNGHKPFFNGLAKRHFCFFYLLEIEGTISLGEKKFMDGPAALLVLAFNRDYIVQIGTKIYGKSASLLLLHYDCAQQMA